MALLTELTVGDTFDYYPAWALADLGRAVCADLDNSEDSDLIPVVLAVIDAEFGFGEWNTTAPVASAVQVYCPEHQWLLDAWS